MSSRGSAPISAEAVRRDPLAALRRRERGVVGRKAAVLESVYQLTRKPGMDHEKRLAAQVRPLTGTMRRPMASIRLTLISICRDIPAARKHLLMRDTGGANFPPDKAWRSSERCATALLCATLRVAFIALQLSGR